jgi:hypothetical protein
MARVVQQPLPDPPPVYDQQYMFRLANAINLFMLQSTAQAKGETIAARFILTDPVHIPGDQPDTAGLPTGMLYLQYAFADSADATVAQQAWATAALTLTTASTPVPGATLTITRTGNYLLIGTFDFTVANEQGALLYGTITDATHAVIVDSASKQGRTPANQQAIVAVSSVPQTLQLLAYKGGGTGNSSVGLQSSLIALWVAGPAAIDATGTGPAFFTLVNPQDK